MPSFFDEALREFERKGDLQKANILKGLSSRIRPSQLARIKDNDKGVLHELFLPKWLSWDILYSWALEEASGKNACVICGTASEQGIRFKEKFLCADCLYQLKNS